MPSNLKGKKVTVVGLGRSGSAAARLLVRKGASVTVTDRRTLAELKEPMAVLNDCPLRYSLGDHPPEAFREAELIVLSPGVGVEQVESIRAARNQGVPVIGEMELGFRFAEAPVVAITGTNGKSTTTALIGEILKQAGGRVFVGGNLGPPLSEAVLERTPWDWIAVEVSSFQLETIQTFHPRVAVLLNVSPNHLDRYRKMEEYIAAKLRIFENQTPADAAVVNADDAIVLRQTGAIRARRVFFSHTPRSEGGVYLDSGAVVATGVPEASGRVEIIRRDEIRLSGAHNLENVLAASAAGLLCGCPADGIRKAIRKFKGLEHRLEPVRKRNGVLFVNDSKATTAVALGKALEAFTEPIVLIAGGQNKGGEFGALRTLLSRRVRTVVLIGEARPVLRAAWDGAAPLVDAGSLDEAVRFAARTAVAGDVVLLAPACASFDMFRDFEDRGNRFKEIVHGL
jgi:UDP-N-acetylmuramoylalanine--D-glutamate ligase